MAVIWRYCPLGWYFFSLFLFRRLLFGSCPRLHIMSLGTFSHWLVGPRSLQSSRNGTVSIAITLHTYTPSHPFTGFEHRITSFPFPALLCEKKGGKKKRNGNEKGPMNTIQYFFYFFPFFSRPLHGPFSAVDREWLFY